MHKYTTKCTQVNPLIRQAWVDLLDRYEWSWFTTLTFRDLPKSYTAINRAKKWLTSLKKEEKRSVPYFLALEWTKIQNKPHLHLLLANLEGVRRFTWWLTWYTQYGAARILPYEKGLGCTHYLCKYVFKDVYRSGVFETRGLIKGRQTSTIDRQK
ncbi:hypothetical protein ES703_114937 [subsurface metagenome]